MPNLITKGYTLLQQILLQRHPLVAIGSKLSYIITTLILLHRKPLAGLCIVVCSLYSELGTTNHRPS